MKAAPILILLQVAHWSTIISAGVRKVTNIYSDIFTNEGFTELLGSLSDHSITVALDLGYAENLFCVKEKLLEGKSLNVSNKSKTGSENI